MILPGGTERVKGTFVDETNSLYDPTAIEIKISVRRVQQR